MYSVDEIKELLSAFDSSKATAMDIQLSENEFLSIRQKTAAPAAVITECVPGNITEQTIVPAAVPASPAPGAAPVAEGDVLESPMVGVFYAAPSPDSEPYVTVGSSVKQGDVLCLIEAMKLMNEVTAEKSGVISEICVENGQVVEYGQPLFRIK